MAVPGASCSTLALIVFPPISGIEKLDPRFAAILTLGSQSITFDKRWQPTLKTSRKEFFVPMPDDDAFLGNRFEVMGS